MICSCPRHYRATPPPTLISASILIASIWSRVTVLKAGPTLVGLATLENKKFCLLDEISFYRHVIKATFVTCEHLYRACS